MLNVFVTLVPFLVNAAVTPCFGPLVNRSAFEGRILNPCPATCHWDFGGLHGNSFAVGENLSQFAVQTETRTQTDTFAGR